MELTTDPAAFLAVAEAHLAADPVVTTVVATVTSRYRDLRAAGEPAPTDWPEWWAVVRDSEGAIAGLAMRTARTPPHPLFVLPMADGAALALARALHARGESVGGLNGSLPSAEVCAAELARLQGDRVEVAQHTRLFELGELVAPVGVPGRLRPATLDDLDLAVDWVGRFMHDADVQAGRDPAAHGREVIEPDDLARRIEGGTYWFWLDDGGRAGAPHRRQRAGVRRGPGRSRVHATGAAQEGVRRGSGRRRSRSTSWTPEPGSASTPTRPTRRPTASTRPSGTSRWSTR